MAGSAFGLPEIASLYDPSVAVDEVQLQRQQQLAQALRQMSLRNTGQTQMAGNVAIKNSPLEGVAQALQAYKANQLDAQSDAQRLALNQRMAQAMASALQEGQPQAPQQAPAPVTDASVPAGSSASPPAASAGAPAPASAPAGGSGPSMAALLRGSIVNSIGGPAMGSAYAKQFEPTDIERQLNAAGITDSTMRHQLIQANIAKQNYIAPVSGRPGGYLQSPTTGAITNLPATPPGYASIQDPNSPTGFRTVPQPGGPEALQGSAASTAIGKTYGEPSATLNAVGQPNPIQPLSTTLGYGNMGNVTPGQQAARDDQRKQILTQELANTTDPVNRGLIQKELDNTQGGKAYTQPGAAYAAPPLGTEQAQTGLDKSWEALKAQNREASNTKSYLQNIVQAAQSGAITGPGADRREMIQGMLQLAGINESVNENAVSQTQLLNKYHNKIVTQLGQGGLGTDAARAMLDSAYPGAPMNVGAIKEAAANLNGAQDMVQAKTRLLQDSALKRDTNTYTQKEIQFDQAADPRIWQWKSIQDPQARSAFAKQLMQQDPTIANRIKALEGMGAL